MAEERKNTFKERVKDGLANIATLAMSKNRSELAKIIVGSTPDQLKEPLKAFVKYIPYLTTLGAMITPRTPGWNTVDQFAIELSTAIEDVEKDLDVEGPLAEQSLPAQAQRVVKPVQTDLYLRFCNVVMTLSEEKKRDEVFHWFLNGPEERQAAMYVLIASSSDEQLTKYIRLGLGELNRLLGHLPQQPQQPQISADNQPLSYLELRATVARDVQLTADIAFYLTGVGTELALPFWNAIQRRKINNLATLRLLMQLDSREITQRLGLKLHNSWAGFFTTAGEKIQVAQTRINEITASSGLVEKSASFRDRMRQKYEDSRRPQTNG